MTFCNHYYPYSRFLILLFLFDTGGAKRKSNAKRKTHRRDFASAEATADPGGSDKPLKRLERNFQKWIKPI